MHLEPGLRQGTYYHLYKGCESWICHFAYMCITKLRGLLFAIDQFRIGRATKAKAAQDVFVLKPL